jgi:hypothetical protein
VPLDDAVRRRQADARSGEIGLRVQPLERPEQLLDMAHVEPGSVVANEEGVRVACWRVHADLDDRPVGPGGELPGIPKEVLQRNSQQPGIGVGEQLVLNRDLRRAAGVVLRQLAGDAPAQRREIDPLAPELRSSYARELEQIVDQLRHAAGCRAHPAQVVLTGFVQPRAVVLQQRVTEPVDAA